MDTSQWIEKLKTVTEMQVLIKDLGLTPQTQKEFWKNLLALLKGQASPISLANGEEGLFKFITDNADLTDAQIPPDELVSYLYENIKALANSQEDSYWNESLQKLIEFFLERFDFEATTTVLPINGEGKSITVQTLKDANAGANFPEYNSNYPNQYVIPWWNADGKSYEEERGHDQLTNTIERPNKLQFTRNGEESQGDVNEWIRLLMPQYGRRVEIEDLNRNFWVISQVIAAISNYLFGDDCPIPKTLEGMTREISELWENVLYLWLGIAATSQEQNNDVQVIVIPLPPRAEDHGRKFDMLDEPELYSYKTTEEGLVITIPDEADFLADIYKRIGYLSELYNKNLCVIPYIRLDNYKHNHYAAEWYPYICTYHKVNGWSAQRIKERVGDKIYELVISPKYEIDNRFSPNIYASKQDSNGRLLYKYPFSELNMTNSDGRLMLYAALRTIPEVSVELTAAQIKVNSLKIRVYDASNDVINGTSREIGVYNYVNEGLESYVHYTPTNSAAPQEDDLLHYKRFETNKPGYYLGEIPSWKGKTARIVEDDDIFNREAYVIKIGSYMPNSSQWTEQIKANAATALMSDGKHTLMRGNISTTLPGAPAANQVNCFWENPWESYVPERDKVGEGNDLLAPSCFDDDIIPVSTYEVNEKYLKTKGLIAVKNYLQKSNLLDSPCYVMTAIGLTPWQNGENIIYWDIGGLCHLYHYVPSVNSLERKPTDNSYSKAYEKIGILDTSNPDEYDGNPSPLIYVEEDYDALCYYQEELAKCQPYIDNKTITGWESPAVYGNIDMDNRQILVDQETGAYETILGAWSTFVYTGITRIIVCFSMLQQAPPPATTPIELTEQQANTYLEAIVDRVMEELAISHTPTYDQYDEIKRRVLEYDAQDKAIVAEVSFCETEEQDASSKAARLSEALHYVGKFGSIQMTAEELQELCDKYDIPFEDFVAIDNPTDFAAVSKGGKIVSCNTIFRLDTFFENYGMCTQDVYTTEIGRWRQFQLISNTNEKCDCIIINEGDVEDDGKIYYDVQFATEFNGTVNYYDNRKAQLWGKDTFDADVQVGTATVKIDNEGYTQSTEEVGFIAKPREGDIKLRENLATSTVNTGFAKSPVNFFDPNNTMREQFFSIYNGNYPVSRPTWKF